MLRTRRPLICLPTPITPTPGTKRHAGRLRRWPTDEIFTLMPPTLFLAERGLGPARPLIITQMSLIGAMLIADYFTAITPLYDIEDVYGRRLFMPVPLLLT